MASRLLPSHGNSLACELLSRFVGRFVCDAALIIIDHKGGQHRCGPRDLPPSAVIRLRSPSIEWRLLLNPQLAFGEGYANGDISIEQGTLRDVLTILYRNQRVGNEVSWSTWLPFRSALASSINHVMRVNSLLRARSNAKHSYDLGNRVFEQFLDPAMQYTCAYFPADVLPLGERSALALYQEQRTEDLDAAQRDKMARIIRKLQVGDGMRVLDIGCGWGGLALEIAKRSPCQVLGISLSAEQVRYANRKAAESGLSDRVRYELMDFRNVSGVFDRIVAVGVLEHVGRPHFARFFMTVDGCLAPQGVFLLHTIGRMDGPGGTNPWIGKHVFPGAYIPSMSEIAKGYEGRQLILSDVEVLRVHYALTLREWSRRFEAAKEQIQRETSERFVRMYRLYLLASELSFVFGRFVNYQMQFIKDRFALPITRDYLYDG
jgi:cyclopropane-fatty-acyl-phospholipid synthase